MLAELTVRELLEKIAGSEPVPGGGSVAALSGALASALAGMVAGLTIGRKGYEEHEELMTHIRQLTGNRLRLFLEDVDRDSDAYQQVFEGFRLPKNTDEEKAIRTTAIQSATRHAALVPLQVARNACELMGIIADVIRLGNRNAITDGCVALMCARSAVLGALMNVRINLGSIKDTAFVEHVQAEADDLEREAIERERELLEIVNQDLRV